MAVEPRQLRAGNAVLMAALWLIGGVATVELLSHVVFPWLFPVFTNAWHRTASYATLAVVALPVLALIGRQHRQTIEGFHRRAQIERALTNTGDDLILHVDHDGLVTWANENFTRRTGWTAEEMRRVPWRERVHPDDVARCAAVRETCLASQTSGTAVYRTRRTDGSYLWVESVMAPLVDDAGRPDGFISRSRDVSRFVALQEELREQADRMRLAQRAGKVGVWEAIAAEERLLPSDLMSEMLGLPIGEPIPFDQWKSMLHPDDRERCAEAFRLAMERGSAYRLTIRIETRDRGLRWVLLDAAVIREGRAAGTCIDVTEQVQQQEKYARSESTLLAFVEHAPVAVAMVDLTFRELLVSRCWQERFPSPTSLWQPGSMSTMLAPADEARWREALTRVMAGEGTVADEGHLRRIDGVDLWLRWEFRPWLGSDGEIAGAVLMVEDIAQQRRVERELREIRAMLEEAQAFARVGSWSFDLATSAVRWSREVFRLFDRDESLGAPDYAWMLGAYEPESAERLDAAVRRALAEGTSYELHLRTRIKSQGTRVMSGRGRAVFAADGRTVVGLVGTIADVTGEVEREAELRRAREAADRGNRAKSEFLASMSHEIRTPMTAILGYAELLVADREMQSDPARVRAAAETVRTNGKHLLAIINDILDLSKIEAGKLEVEHLPTNVGAVLFEVQHLLEPSAITKGLSVTLASSLPPNQLFILDPIRLRQIVVNLVGNAIKFTNSGSVQLEAALIEGPTATLLIRVRDTGIGMSQEQLARVFGAFEQGDASTARRFGGTGLGLRISLRLAELMGGKLEAQSVSGQGSLFSLSLPAVTQVARRPAVRTQPA